MQKHTVYVTMTNEHGQALQQLRFPLLPPLNISNFITNVYIYNIFVITTCQERRENVLSVEKTMLFLLSRVDQMSSQQFVEIYEQRGYTSTYIRNSLSRLKKRATSPHPPVPCTA